MEEFSKSDIINAVAANDEKWLSDVLCSRGYEDKDSWAIFTEDDKVFMSTLFASAAIAAQNGILKPEIIDLLIERTHSVVNIYNFLDYYRLARRGYRKDVGFDLIPEDVKRHLKRNDIKYGEEIGTVIQGMSSAEFDALGEFIFEETESLHKSFGYPLIHHISEHDLISKAQLMLIMGSSLSEPLSDEEAMLFAALGSLFR